jgi:hypothetical protein
MAQWLWHVEPMPWQGYRRQCHTLVSCLGFIVFSRAKNCLLAAWGSDPYITKPCALTDYHALSSTSGTWHSPCHVQ